jgi:hypothetical protein
VRRRKMLNFETLPIQEYIVKNEDTGITFHRG